jgi:hypothetical protein
LTADSVPLVIWGAAESAITIIAASIPILRALVRDNRPPPGQFCTEDERTLASPRPTTAGPHAGDIELRKL